MRGREQWATEKWCQKFVRKIEEEGRKKEKGKLDEQTEFHSRYHPTLSSFPSPWRPKTIEKNWVSLALLDGNDSWVGNWHTHRVWWAHRAFIGRFQSSPLSRFLSSSFFQSSLLLYSDNDSNFCRKISIFFHSIFIVVIAKRRWAAQKFIIRLHYSIEN